MKKIAWPCVVTVCHFSLQDNHTACQSDAKRCVDMKQHRAGCQSALEARIEIVDGGSLQNVWGQLVGRDLPRRRVAGLSGWVTEEGEK